MEGDAITYDLCCLKCRVGICIGQSHDPKNFVLYFCRLSIKSLEQFFRQHRDHKLQLFDTMRRPDGFRVEGEEDE